MKNAFCFLFILCALVPVCLGQDKTPTTENKWTRIETEDKEISFSLPAGFLVDATTKTRDQRYRLFGFENGVAMELKVLQPDNPKKYLGQITDRFLENAKLSSFDFNGVPGKTFASKTDRYRSTIHLAFKNNFYTFTINASDENKAETDRFFCSIKVLGKSLYTCKETFSEANSTGVLLSLLETSAKVSEALNRKQEGKEGNIVYELEAFNKTGATDKDTTRQPAIILERGSPKPGALRIDGNIITGVYIIKFRTMLLANGQFGDVTVLSNLDKAYVKKFIEAARKSKFIPAEVDGKPVDSEYLFNYTVETF